MPHDRTGRRVAVGDVIRFKGYDGQVRTGVVSRVTEGAASCNLDASYPVPTVVMTAAALTAADVELLATADGRPASELEPDTATA